MRFIDAHHHLWDLEKHRYAWREKSGTSEAAGRGTYLIGDYLADAGLYGLYRSVHVEGNFDPSDPVAETAWLQQVADAHGFPHGIVGFAALHEPNVAAVLEGHLQHRNFRGIRHILNWDPNPQLSQCDRPDYIGDRRWRAGFAFLARYGLSFDLQAHPWQMPQAAALATEYPDVQVVVDHLGMPVYRGEAGWESAGRAIAKCSRPLRLDCRGCQIASGRTCWLGRLRTCIESNRRSTIKEVTSSCLIPRLSSPTSVPLGQR